MGNKEEKEGGNREDEKETFCTEDKEDDDLGTEEAEEGQGPSGAAGGLSR